MVSTRMIPSMPMDIRIAKHLASPIVTTMTLLMLLAVGPGCGETAPVSTEATPLQTTEVYAESGSQLGQFIYPRGMDVYLDAGEPRAAIVDKTARIQVIDLKTGEVLGAVHTPRWDNGKPTGISVSNSLLDPTKIAVYVADTHEHRVLMYELPLPKVGVPVPTEPDWSIGSFGTEPGQFIYPTDIAIDTDEHGVVTQIYISEYGGNDRISRFSIDHTTEPPVANYDFQLGVAGEEVDASDHPLALSRPQSIELWTTPQGQREILVTDASHHRVGRITTEGELVAWFGDPMDQSEDAYRFPYGITILDDGTALITEFGANQFRCIDLATGETLWRYGIGGRSRGELVQPWDTGVIGDQLIVLDSGNNRLQLCTLPKGVSSIGQEIGSGFTSAQSPHGENP